MEYREMILEIAPNTRVGRYEIITRIASGGMASVYLARVLGAAGFNRLVALKHPHPHILSDERIMKMFMDEARLAARIRHPNVIPTLDFEQAGDGFFMVMEYVEGHGLNNLLEKAAQLGQRVPPPLALRLVIDILHGLHDAHELRSEYGVPMGLVHRDVSPHNVLVGVDGVARIGDFGVAHARERLSSTRLGEIKGKFSYMSPEQISGGVVDRRADVFACGAVLWECLAGRRLFPETNNVSALLLSVINDPLPDLRLIRSDVHDAILEALHKALQRDPAARFSTALQFAEALEAAGEKVGIFGPRVVGQWVQALGRQHLERLRQALNDAPPMRAAPVPTPPVGIPLLRLSPSAFSGVTPTHHTPPFGSSSEVRSATTPLPGALPSGFGFKLQDTSLAGRSHGSSTNGYLEHFGLGTPPFSDVRQPQLFWAGGPYTEAIGALGVSISGDRDPILLLGEPGSGRTFLTEMLRYSVPGLQLFVVEPSLLFGASPLVELCRRLGVDAPPQLTTEMLLGIFLDAARAADSGASRVLIALDNFVPDEPELVQELLRISRAMPSMVHLLLIGAPDLPERLVSAGAGELLSSRASRIDLRPMSLQEMNDYLDFRFRLASRGTLPLALPPASRQFLHARSDGLPRLVNIYAYNALLIAYLQKTLELSVNVIRMAMKSANYLSLQSAAALIASEG